ncbi:MAG: hypothetical protein ACN6N2_00320 [Acinetobacter calcoaceticus]
MFDLDQTIRDRTKSLIKFIEWQVNYYQLVPQKNKKAFITRFIELDNNGSVWKDLVYSQLIKEFPIEKFSVNELLSSYISDFNKFAVAFENVGMRTIFFHSKTSMSYSLADSQIHHYDELKTTNDYLNKY